jgi:CRISPR-associated protein Cas1
LQLLVKQKDNNNLLKHQSSIPIEDIGILVLDNPQITFSAALISALMTNNVAVISCDDRHMPHGCMLPYAGNTLLTERYRMQLGSSEPLKKQIWQQIVAAKIRNQAAVLDKLNIDSQTLKVWANEVKSGDSVNLEGAAAAYYFDRLFTGFVVKFKRAREGDAPNNVLNYMYAIIRAITARAIVSAGLLPAVGIHHRNKYNPYCLADDLMEPFRPFADIQAVNLIRENIDISALIPSLKSKLLAIATVDVHISNERSPLMIAIQKEVDSLVNCLKGERRKLELPLILPYAAK